MPDTLLVVFPFVLAGVLLISGIAKGRRPDGATAVADFIDDVDTALHGTA